MTGLQVPSDADARAPAAGPRFAIDRMLAKLGSYLRILGYDSIWDPHLRIHELTRLADAEGRVVLTCNKHVGCQFPVPRQWLLVPSTKPADQLKYVVMTMKLDIRSHLFTLCVKCNVPNQEVPDKRFVRGLVPERVWMRFQTFTRCPACGSVYWLGTHVYNTCVALGLDFPFDNSTAKGPTNQADPAPFPKQEEETHET